MCMKVNVEVTAKDIQLGVPEKEESCAIARPLKRAGFKNVSVGAMITVQKMGVRWVYTGDAHKKFIYAFDVDKKKVKPRKFNFSFKPVEVVQEESEET